MQSLVARMCCLSVCSRSSKMHWANKGEHAVLFLFRLTDTQFIMIVTK